MNFGEKTRKRVTINITSLVDILIVLLLFFMLTTQFIHMERLNLNISPGNQIANSDSAPEAKIKIILIGDGKFTLNGREFNLLQLREKIKPLLEDASERNIIIACKNKAYLQDVVLAIDYIKAAGGKNVSIAEDNL